MNIKNHSTDFLIIGSGLAGLYAAYYASQFGKVALVTKAKLEESNSYWAQGGIAAAIAIDDSTEFHFDDTLIAGRDLCDKKTVKVLVEEGKLRVEELIKLGVPFDKEKGKLILGMEGGHSKRRILHSGGDSTGAEVVEHFTKLVKQNKNISIFTNTFIYQLLTNDSSCSGSVGYNWETKEQIVFSSPSTILAAGGASGIYSRSTNPFTSSGDGIGLAYSAGAEIRDMEFLQFHPTSFYTKEGDTFLITEAVRGEGAYLLNIDGKRFMLDVHPKAELAPRDVVSRAIYNELKKDNAENVYLDLSHLNAKKIKEKFNGIYQAVLSYGLDITKDLIPVAPAAHYMIGGVNTDLNGRTNTKGLFACGEVTSTGVHGANRLASNSLLECLVFAKRCVDKSLSTSKVNAKENPIGKIHKFEINNMIADNYLIEKNNIAKILNGKLGIVRTEKNVKEALEEIQNIRTNYSFDENEYYSIMLNNLFEISLMIAKAAMLRKESRGTHQSLEYTIEEDSFLGHFCFIKDGNAKFEKLGN
ncbi:MAG: L-aspartate oxidase [Melioribacteraceae bacterium]